MKKVKRIFHTLNFWVLRNNHIGEAEKEGFKSQQEDKQEPEDRNSNQCPQLVSTNYVNYLQAGAQISKAPIFSQTQ